MRTWTRWAPASPRQRCVSSGSPIRGDELTEPDDDRSTPNMVLGPVVADAGLVLWADTWSELPTPMLATMVRILVEELERVGAHAHIGPGPLPSVVNPVALPDWTPTSPPRSGR